MLQNIRLMQVFEFQSMHIISVVHNYNIPLSDFMFDRLHNAC